MRKILSTVEPTPTIGSGNVTFKRMPVHRRIDFYDCGWRIHGLIALAPLAYGAVQTWREQPLSTWFWGMVVATLGFAVFARRPACLRLSPGGLSFPDQSSREYPWQEMREARARNEQLDILMADGLNVVISYRKLRRRDIDRLKRLMKAQFQAMAEYAKAADASEPRAEAA